MAIEFNCPHCEAFYKLDEKFAGKMGKCKNAKCQQSILIPFRSTAATQPSGPNKRIDAEAMAAAALAEEQPVKEKAAAPIKKITVTCQYCDHVFDVDAGLAGKNTTCPECKKINRVAKLVEDKPADWRTGAGGKPSMAKVTEPVPTGAWDVQRTGVSAQSLQKAGALEFEDDEEPRDRRIRRIKQILYGSALLGILVFVVIVVTKWRREGKEEKWMDKAVAEIEDKKDGSKKPEFRAAVYTYSGEYHLRAAEKREELEAALNSFNKARDELQKLPPENVDRNAMLIELGVNLVACGGTSAEISDERRLPWDEVHPLIRKCLDKIPADELELRARSMRLLVGKLNEKDQGPLAVRVAKNGFAGAEAEMIGRIGIELFLLGKKELAEKVLEQAPQEPLPALTALWLALHPNEKEPPKSLEWVPPPETSASKTANRDSRIAYAEGRALQGKIKDAYEFANLPGNAPDKVDALILVAAVALDLGKPEEVGPILEDIVSNLKPGAIANSWALVRAVELAVRANKMEAAQTILEAIDDEQVRSWAKLEILRLKLAGREKGIEKWLEAIPEPPDARLAPAIAEAEVARHNKAAGENFDAESLPKGTVRPFGYAGIALGAQDRHPKK